MRKQDNWTINESIRHSEVRVLNEKGEQVGVMSTKDALDKAKEEQKDLVEIAPKAKPPVVKIIEFGKFKYQEEKKKKKAQKAQKGGDIKEIRFSPFIGEADYSTRLERIKEFLEDKNKVRAVVKYTGRQMSGKSTKQFGYDLLGRIVKELGESILVDMEPKFVGRHLIMVISPLSNPKTSQNKKS